MLEELRKLRDMGYPKEFLDNYALYRCEYARLPLSERMQMDFGYFLRMLYIEYLKNRS